MSVYLDWAATAPPDPEIIDRYREVALTEWANPSSPHPAGTAAEAALRDARKRCAGVLGVKDSNIIFTSGGTESDYLPLLSLLARPTKGSLAVSAIEHPAILEQARMLSHAGWEVLLIQPDSEGFVSPQAVLNTIRADTALVAVMAVNNETGAVQPVIEIGEALLSAAAGKRKAHFHVDAVQAIGKIPFQLAGSAIDSASCSAHKIGGPKGVGLLYMSRRVEPFIRGGSQEEGLRPGTVNVAGAAALAMALEKNVNQTEQADYGSALMNALLTAMSAIPGFTLIPETRTRSDNRFSPWILQASNRKFPGEVLVRMLADKNIYISTGSACSSKKKGRPVLEAMRLDGATIQNAFRVSIGPRTLRSDIDTFITALAELLA